MKKYILKSLFLLSVSAATLTSCTSDNDYNIPPFKTPFFTINFDGLSTNTDFSDTGFINKNLLDPTRKWRVTTHNGSESYEYLSFSSFIGGNNPAPTNDNTWLILPATNVEAGKSIALNFDIVQGYPTNAFPLKVVYSTDFDGNEDNITNATWTELNITYNFNPPTRYSDPFKVKAINIPNTTSENKDVYVAFNYIGSNQGNGSTHTIQLDNIKLSK